ncbi:MAG: hypothetical protein ACK4N6_02385 [Rhodocyclaceae bacterium]
MKLPHWPLTTLFFFALGALCAIAGIAVFAGWLEDSHPLLADEMAGWGLIVSAIACLLTGAFPLVLRRLAEREGA